MSQLKTKAEKWVEMIIKQGVKLVCWDWDQTISCIHTGGYIKCAFSELPKAIEKLSTTLSVDFLACSTLLNKAGIHQAITTHACDDPIDMLSKTIIFPGKAMIQSVLNCKEKNKSDMFHIIALWDAYESKRTKAVKPGKHSHIEMAMLYYGLTDQKQVALVDDSFQVVSQAVSNTQAHVYWVSKEKGFDIDTCGEWKKK